MGGKNDIDAGIVSKRVLWSRKEIREASGDLSKNTVLL